MSDKLKLITAQQAENVFVNPVNKYAAKKITAIEAAASVFAEKGFHGATTQDIASEMGIQQGSLYYYFKSKEQALQEVCEYGFDKHVKRMAKICARKQPFEAKMQMIITSHLSNYRQKNNALKVHNDQRLYLPKQSRTVLKELGTHYRRLLEQTLREGIDQSAVRADIDTHFIAYSVIGICNAWGANLVRDEELDLYDTIEQCADLILRGTLNL
ncbi:MAG: TetR/AcrR family transcriptional regulator [Acidiferrobacterales bacterium]|nr:TetR/AcrR family transcriptional regulator [Acidiferrobacterales bacterium]